MEPIGRKALRHFNLDFYKGEGKWPTENLTISEFHTKKRGDYQFLQKCHSYVQWLFPNQHKSNFNYYSYALSPEERESFRKDKLIGINLIKSYAIYVDFMGARISNFETGELALTNKKRLYDVLLIYRHNHLRLTRIISCLSGVGLRPYAVSLIGFLNQQTKGDGKLQDVRRVFEHKWQRYDDDFETVKICGLLSQVYLNVRHPVLDNKDGLLQLENEIKEWWGKESLA